MSDKVHQCCGCGADCSEGTGATVFVDDPRDYRWGDPRKPSGIRYIAWCQPCYEKLSQEMEAEQAQHEDEGPGFYVGGDDRDRGDWPMPAGEW